MTSSKDQYIQLQECTVLDEWRAAEHAQKWRDEEGDNELKEKRK